MRLKVEGSLAAEQETDHGGEADMARCHLEGLRAPGRAWVHLRVHSVHLWTRLKIQIICLTLFSLGEYTNTHNRTVERCA